MGVLAPYEKREQILHRSPDLPFFFFAFVTVTKLMIPVISVFCGLCSIFISVSQSELQNWWWLLKLEYKYVGMQTNVHAVNI